MVDIGRYNGSVARYGGNVVRSAGMPVYDGSLMAYYTLSNTLGDSTPNHRDLSTYSSGGWGGPDYYNSDPSLGNGLKLYKPQTGYSNFYVEDNDLSDVFNGGSSDWTITSWVNVLNPQTFNGTPVRIMVNDDYTGFGTNYIRFEVHMRYFPGYSPQNRAEGRIKTSVGTTIYSTINDWDYAWDNTGWHFSAWRKTGTTHEWITKNPGGTINKKSNTIGSIPSGMDTFLFPTTTYSTGDIGTVERGVNMVRVYDTALSDNEIIAIMDAKK